MDKLLTLYKMSRHGGRDLFDACSEFKKMKNTKTFFGFTSELINDGTYGLIYELLNRKSIEVIVTNADTIIQDILFNLINREFKSENLNDEELKVFKEFIQKIEARTLEKGNKALLISEFVHEIGLELGLDSLLGYAAEQGVRVYVPDFCDSLFGLHLNNLIIDQLGDCKKLNKECFFVKKTSAVVLGTSNIKHAILNSNLFKNGLNSCIMVNSCNEMDCSDSGANVDEAISWGKIQENTKSIKIHGDPSIVFPILCHFWLKEYEAV